MATKAYNLLTYPAIRELVSALPEYDSIEGHVWREYLPIDDYGTSQVMWSEINDEALLAGMISMEGVALPTQELPHKRYLAGLENIGASYNVLSEEVREINDPGVQKMIETPNSFMGRQKSREIERMITERIQKNIKMMERQKEYLFHEMLRGKINWPPLAADGSAISNPMSHWNPAYVMSFTLPNLRATFTQKATELEGYGWDGVVGSGTGELGTQVAWNATGANALYDIDIITTYMRREFGLFAPGGEIFMNWTTFNTIARQQAIRDVILGTDATQSGSRAFVDEESFRQFILTTTRWQFRIYAGKPWTYRTGTGTSTVQNPVEFLKDGDVFFIPDSTVIGNMGRAPHETQDEQWVHGPAPWFVKDNAPPYNRRGGLREIAFPVPRRMNEVFRLKAFE